VGIAALSYSTNDFSVWWKQIGTTEYIWLAVTTNNDIVVRRGELSTTGITWHGTEQVALNGSGASDTYSYPYVSLDSSNYVWVGARYYNGTNYVYRAADSVGTGDSNWATLTWNSATTLSANQTDANVFGNIVPRNVQDMTAVWIANTSIQACHWDDSDGAWENSGGLSCTAGNRDSVDTGVNGLTKNLSAVVDGTSYDVHLIYLDDETTDQVSYKRWDSGTAAWDSSPINLDASNNDAYLTLSFDSTTRDIYALYIDTSLSDIFYRQCDFSAATSECSASGDWLTEVAWKTSGTNTYVTSNYASASRIFAEWTIGSASPFVIGWDIVLIPEKLWLWFGVAPLFPLLLRRRRAGRIGFLGYSSERS
jgi:hypothetical protein